MTARCTCGEEIKDHPAKACLERLAGQWAGKELDSEPFVSRTPGRPLCALRRFEFGIRLWVPSALDVQAMDLLDATPANYPVRVKREIHLWACEIGAFRGYGELTPEGRRLAIVRCAATAQATVGVVRDPAHKTGGTSETLEGGTHEG